MTKRPYLFLLSASLVLAAGCSSSTPGVPADSGTTALEASAEDSSLPEGSPGADAFGSPVYDAATVDASPDAGSDVYEAAAMPTCGPPPARYTLLTDADNGLVRDNMTDLVWMNNSVGGGEPPQHQSNAATYCSGRGMRLPTKDEALALANAFAACAFGQWSTWTSTPTPVAGDFWVVDYLGGMSPQLGDNFPSAVLCVRNPAG